MATSLTARIRTTIVSTCRNLLDLTRPEDKLDEEYDLRLANGTGDNQANLQWHDRITIPSMEVVQLDLTALPAGAFGIHSFAKVRAVIVNMAGGTEASLAIGGMGQAGYWVGMLPWIDTQQSILFVPDGGRLIWTAAENSPDVGPGNNLLRLSNGYGEPITFDIIIIGVSA